MHWDQMTDTTDDLRRRVTRLRCGVGQLGILESIIEASFGPWLGAVDADGRGAAELRMHLIGRFRLTAVVTSAGKFSVIQLNAPKKMGGERVLSPKAALRKGWEEAEEAMPKQQQWLDYVMTWVEDASAAVDRRAILEHQLKGADRRLVALENTLEGLRANLREREQVRDELAAEVEQIRRDLRTELEARAAKRGVTLPPLDETDSPAPSSL
ncbi:hypothetical protein [Nocardia huaxiensis]|uniref:Uncharacterized protein n=1 Tax=Nocardia huaxiensis TaxID=2755382 RepID=A0A7D6YZZ0_9NOCA|nr:hypothetical protein [Nocardia huaxiensis]QLY28926.1 hypothetical protein H0264_26845 [Nocardia huaxiensis]UFS97599.1 hypothetical protein LPY97_06755 [Nocardia huaxiensis]